MPRRRRSRTRPERPLPHGLSLITVTCRSMRDSRRVRSLPSLPGFRLASGGGDPAVKPLAVVQHLYAPRLGQEGGASSAGPPQKLQDPLQPKSPCPPGWPPAAVLQSKPAVFRPAASAAGHRFYLDSCVANPRKLF